MRNRCLVHSARTGASFRESLMRFPMSESTTFVGLAHRFRADHRIPARPAADQGKLRPVVNTLLAVHVRLRRLHRRRPRHQSAIRRPRLRRRRESCGLRLRSWCLLAAQPPVSCGTLRGRCSVLDGACPTNVPRSTATCTPCGRFGRRQSDHSAPTTVSAPLAGSSSPRYGLRLLRDVGDAALRHRDHAQRYRVSGRNAATASRVDPHER